MACSPAGLNPLRNLGGGALERHAAGRVQCQLGFTPATPGEYIEVERRTPVGDPDELNAETVAKMCSEIAAATKDPQFRRVALNCAALFRGGPLYGGDPFGPGGIARSCWAWVKHFVTFQHH